MLIIPFLKAKQMTILVHVYRKGVGFIIFSFFLPLIRLIPHNQTQVTVIVLKNSVSVSVAVIDAH